MSDSYKNNESNCSAIQCECIQVQLHHPYIPMGEMVVKVPVVLAHLTLQISLDAIITFPEPVLEIKDIKQKVVLTQCQLLLPTNKLFITGFIRKNIQYVRPNSRIKPPTSTTISSALHSLTVDVPLQCTAEIKDYLSKPVMSEINTGHEFDFNVSEPLTSDFTKKDEILTSNPSQFHQVSSQFYNELPFCELLSSKIIEWDEAIDRVPFPEIAPIGEGYFSKMEEKMVVYMTLNVLQNQHIQVSSSTNDKDVSS
ncbi:DUF3794 domain-containing protein [Bacillus sp. JJ634]